MTLLEFQCAAAKVPKPVTEYKFHPTRKWRFDYCWPDRKVALEIEGGVFVKGRHTRGVGYLKDMEKYSEAAILGWCVVRCTPQQLNDGSAFTWVKRALDRERSGT